MDQDQPLDTPAPSSRPLRTTHTAIILGLLITDWHWLHLPEFSLFPKKIPNWLDAEEIKSRIIICPLLYSKFKANGTSLTKFYAISPIQSGEGKNFPFLPGKFSTQRGLKGQSGCNLTGIYTAEVFSVFAASAKMKKPHWTVVGNCMWSVILWSPEQEHF